MKWRGREMLMFLLCMALAALVASPVAASADPDEVLTQMRERADRRIAEILATPNPCVPSEVPARYLSAAMGDDTADGRSPQTAWRTIARLNAENLPPGSWVLFERGGVYRGSVQAVTNDLTFASYGKGPKPLITSSPANGADPRRWVRTDNPNVWAFDMGHADVGTLVFDGGRAHAIKVILKTDPKTGKKSDLRSWRPFDSYRDLAGDLHFWHDYYETGTGKVYLYSAQNPGERFSSIEFNVGRHGIAVAADGLTVDNLAFAYIGSHGVGAGSCRNMTVRNCTFAWIGGSIQKEGLFGRNFPTRFGNAVEVWGSCDGYVVSNCHFRQVYDAAITHQFKVHESLGLRRFDQRNITYANNVIEKCNYSVEYFLAVKNGNESRMENIRIVDNLMFDAGRGFCEQRPDPWVSSHVMAFAPPGRNRARNFLIKGNVMCFARNTLVFIGSSLPSPDGGTSLPRLEDNLLIGRLGDDFGLISDSDGEVRKCESSCQALLDARGSGNRLLLISQQKE